MFVFRFTQINLDLCVEHTTKWNLCDTVSGCDYQVCAQNMTEKSWWEWDASSTKRIGHHNKGSDESQWIWGHVYLEWTHFYYPYGLTPHYEISGGLYGKKSELFLWYLNIPFVFIKDRYIYSFKDKSVMLFVNSVTPPPLPSVYQIGFKA